MSLFPASGDNNLFNVAGAVAQADEVLHFSPVAVVLFVHNIVLVPGAATGAEWPHVELGQRDAVAKDPLAARATRQRITYFIFIRENEEIDSVVGVEGLVRCVRLDLGLGQGLAPGL
jgi:hypothetical protein